MPAKEISVCKHSCVKNGIQCNSIHIIAKKDRFCYEIKYGLKRVESQMRYTKDGRTHIVATGIIDNIKASKEVRVGKARAYDNYRGGIEENFRRIVYGRIENKGNLTYIVKEACKELHYNFNKLMKKIKKIREEVIRLDEANTDPDPSNAPSSARNEEDSFAGGEQGEG